MSSIERRYPIGAELIGENETHFRLWAPKAREVDVVLEAAADKNPEFCPLTAEPGGYFSGAANASATVSSFNAFKNNPGTGGLAQSQTTTFSVPGATAALKDAKGNLLGAGTTDQDGWYLFNYKATGKATTYYLTLTPPGSGAAQTRAFTLKANGYVEVDFTTP